MAELDTGDGDGDASMSIMVFVFEYSVPRAAGAAGAVCAQGAGTLLEDLPIPTFSLPMLRSHCGREDS